MKRKFSWKSVFIGVCLLTSLVLNMIFMHTINILDFSLQKPVKMSSTNDATNNFYLMSYADGKDVFFQNRNLLAASSINRGFDFILNYRRDHIEPDYIHNHPILNETIGAGYWLWKPYLILKTLQRIPDGAIVMYADSSIIIRQPPMQYLNKQFTPGKDILAFAYNPKQHGIAATIASRDTFAALNCADTRCRQAQHVWAGILVLRNSEQSRAFIKEWLKYCEQDTLLRGDSFIEPNYAEFTHHQHDEAILSVLATREANMVNFVDIDPIFYEHFAVHMRKRNQESLIALMSVKNMEIEHVIQNIWPTNKLRNMLQ